MKTLAVLPYTAALINMPWLCFNLLSAKLTKWPNTRKQFVGNLLTNCLSVFGHFVGLAIKGVKARHEQPNN